MLHRPVLDGLIQVVSRHERGERLGEADVGVIVAGRDERQRSHKMEYDGLGAIERGGEDARGAYFVADGVAVVPVHGVICKYSSMVGGMSQPRGMTSDQLAGAIEAAHADVRVKSVLLDIDSPGGTVAGGDDLVSRMRAARETSGKPMVALAHDRCCSGGYLVAAQCDEVWCTECAVVGSLGAYMVVEDSSEAMEKLGITRRVIASGAFKGMGEPGTPVTEPQVAEVQRNIDAMAAWYVRKTLIEGRKMTAEQAAKIADGRVWIGDESRDIGLVEGVTTLPDLVRAMAGASISLRAA